MSSGKNKKEKKVNPLGKHSSTCDQRIIRVPDSVQKYVTGERRANIMKLNESFPNVRVECNEYFEHVIVSGPSADVSIVSQRIKSIISEHAQNICVKMKVEQHFIGAVIGKNGAHINLIQRETDTHINIDPKTNTIRIEGTTAGVLDAKKRIENKVKASEQMIFKNLAKKGFSHPEYLMLTMECTPAQLLNVSDNLAKYTEQFPGIKIVLDKELGSIDIRGKKNDAREVKKDILKRYVKQ